MDNNELSKEKKVILYFLCISKAQKSVQKHQQLLVSHPCFNPFLLFKKYFQKEIGFQRDILD